MKEHHLSVTSLEEFPANREFVGRNFNAGEVIQLVLKSPTSGRWLPFRYVQMVMMHELAHCKQMNHSRAFWAVRNGYAAEMKGLWSKNYTGEGIWGRGAQLGTGEWERNTIAEGEALPEHLCGGTYRSRRKRKAPKLSYQEQKQRRIEKKFGKNGVALGEDISTKVKLEGGKVTKGKPRVAGSARGRDLRAAAALARFEKIKEEVKEEVKQEIKDEDDDDTASDDDSGQEAVDINGVRLVDGQGRGMVKVCEEEDDSDPAVKQEMDELYTVFSSVPFIKPEQSPDPEPSTSSLIEEEAVDHDEEAILAGPEPWRVLIKREPAGSIEDPMGKSTKTHLQPNSTDDIGPDELVSEPSQLPCKVCSFFNDPLAPTCAMCSNVMNAAISPGSWSCSRGTCKDSTYMNSRDCGVCGLCGQQRKERNPEAT